MNASLSVAGLVAAGSLWSASAAPSATVAEVPVPTDLPPLPWVDGSMPMPDGGLANLGEIRTPDARLLATVAGGWSAECLHVAVVVEDPDHVAPANAGVLWSADSLEVGLDLAGDGSGTLPAETSGPIGPDDAKLIFGLLADGPAAAVLASRGRLDAAALASHVRIDRTAGPPFRTRYRLALPWRAFGAAGGARPVVGIDLQVNQRNREDADKTPHFWGDGLRGGYTAARLRRFVLGPPPHAFASVAWEDTLAWRPDARSVLSVGLRADEPQPLRLRLGSEAVELTLPAGPGWRFLRVAVPAAPDGSALEAHLADLAVATAVQTSAAELQGRLMRRLAELSAAADLPPLFRRHLDSLAALVSCDWGRVLLRPDSDPRRAVASLEHYRALLAGLEGEAGDWASYVEGRRSLLMAYVSPHDQTVQFYFLGLPKAWDPARAYPLFFELHGAGDDHPMGGVAARLGGSLHAGNLAGYETPRVYAETDRAGYWVYPFGRGNLGYAGIARIDVLEAYDDIHRLVQIDPDRRYLYGFSMGGGGAFALGMRTPSRWAGVCAMAGTTGREPLRTSLLGNFALVPLKMLCGEDDSLFAHYRFAVEALRAQGLAPEARSLPGLGHRYTAEMQEEAIEWLKRQRRQRPAAFRFAVDDNLTGEAWGVRLHVDQGTTPRRGGGGRFGTPRLVDAAAPAVATAKVRIEGQTVDIETEGARGLSLDFSVPDGLALSGEVRVLWNGREAYRGPAKPLDLQP